jgi:hypothetical protein
MIRGGILAVLLCVAAAGAERPLPPPSRPVPRPAVTAFAGPLDFEENLGQADPAVRFVARADGYLGLLADDGAVFVHGAGAARMAFVGARPGRLAGGALRPGATNHPPRVAGARRFGGAVRPGIWPGIDLRWLPAKGRRLEYAFDLAPGADPSAIRIAFGGLPARVDGAGDLVVEAPGGVLRHGRPRAFQGEREVAAGFAIRDDGSVGFALGSFDRTRPLVIDPQVVFTSSHGAAGTEEAWAVATDLAGNLYFAGWTLSSDFPVSSAAYDKTAPGNYDAFVIQRSPRGASLVYATYLGGEGADLAYALAVEPGGAAVVAGGTQSDDFPATDGAFRATRGAAGEAGFVARLAPGGSTLSWATFVGGAGNTSVRAIRLGAGGDAFLGGTTSSSDFPVTDAPSPVLAGGTDAFAARLAAGGATLPWAAFLGGTFNEEGRGLGLAPDGTLYLGGSTESPDFPDAAAWKDTLRGSRDAFLAGFAPGTGALAFATFLGGDGLEEAWGLAVDPAGRPWIAGYTTSADLPLANAVDNLYGGQHEAFASRFSADGATLEISTFLGGSASDKAEALAIDGAGVVYVVGRTASPDFPLKEPVDLFYGGGDFDPFVTAISPSGTVVLWSTFLGGSGTDYAMAAAVDRFRSVVVAGRLEQSSGEGNALGSAIQAVPLPPATLTARLVGLNRVRLDWPDQGTTEDGYVVERRQGEGPWAEVKALPMNAKTTTEYGLLYATAYSWRVSAYNEYGRSVPSDEATVTTLPYPSGLPAAPTNLRTTFFDTRSVRLAWNDNATDEDSYVLDRAAPGEAFVHHAVLDRNVASFEDLDVLPLRTYRYRVRAANPVGVSDWSETLFVTLDASFAMEVTAARRKMKDPFFKDSIVLEGRVETEIDTRWTQFNPTTRSLEIRLGNDPVALVQLPAGYAGWKLRRGIHQLRFKFSDRGKLAIDIDQAARTFKVNLSKAELAEVPEGPEALKLLFGEDGAAFDIDWIPGRKAGDYRFP